ncbi:MAG: glycerate kinase [Trueperaceae bacterium]
MPEHPEALLRDAFAAAVAAADPADAVRPHLPEPPSGRLVVVGAGKAAVAMARAVEQAYAARGASLTGAVVVRRGAEGAATRPDAARAIAVYEAAHPVPDAAGAEATRRVLDLVDGAGAEDHVLVLVSGGGSALLGAPAGLALADLQEVVAGLLRSGADVAEMNVVRRRLGAAAGGRLAFRAAPAPVTALVVSDVVGDDPADVASGPTVPDPTGDADALAVLDRYGVDAPGARARLTAGALALAPEAGHASWSRVRTIVVASARRSLDAAARRLRRAGLPTALLAPDLTGEARDAGGFLAAVALGCLDGAGPLQPPCAFVSGGETTVTVRGDGRGGRNSEAALGLALALPAGAPIWALCADSDGIDGTGPHAGAFVGPDLWRRVDRAWARAALDRNDSASVFERAGALFAPGATGTNVNDVRLLLVGRPATEQGRSR